MTRPIPKQYWKFYTPERLAGYDVAIARETAWGTEDSLHTYALRLWEIAMLRYEEFNQANREFQTVTEQVLAEAFGAAAAGGLELKLTFDENGELPYDTLLPHASLPTQERYRKTRQNAAQLLALSQILAKEYNETRERYEEVKQRIEEMRRNQ